MNRKLDKGQWAYFLWEGKVVTHYTIEHRERESIIEQFLDKLSLKDKNVT